MLVFCILSASSAGMKMHEGIRDHPIPPSSGGGRRHMEAKYVSLLACCVVGCP